MPTTERRISPWLLGLAVAAVTLAVFRPALDLAFPYLDDYDHILGNRHVNQGLSIDGLRWAFTSFVEGHWNPLMFVSLMLDASLFGVRLDWLHFVNVALHAASAGLLAATLAEATGESRPSLLAAGLFALHPLRVESVAWVSCRKDVLSILFAIGAVSAYLRFGRSRSRAAWAAAHFLLAASLLSKATAVTLPFLFLLLDRWPLDRLHEGARALVKEKLGLLAISAAVAVVAFLGQRHFFMVPLDQLSLSARLRHVPVAYLEYLRLSLWPSDLNPEHPFRWATAGAAAGATAVLLAISAAAWRKRDTHPGVLIGWLWFLGAFVPLIGFVQLGHGELGNRYTYLPHIGLAIALAWAASAAAQRSATARRLLAGIGVFAVAGCALATRRELAIWADPVRFLERSLAANPDSFDVANLLAMALAKEGDLRGAEERLRAALSINPDYAVGRANLALLLAREGRFKESLPQIESALVLSPHSARFHRDRGLILSQSGNWGEAAKEFEQAVELGPDEPDAYAGLAGALFHLGRPAEAAKLYGLALEKSPRDADLHNNLGIVWAASGRRLEAKSEFETALRLRPGFEIAKRNLELAASDRSFSDVSFSQALDLR